MSLFKAREWWATTSGFQEFHDLGCLSVGNIDNESSCCDKIIVGSFQGLVRIYEPHTPTCIASHVILEKQLDMPIIQVALGQFVQNSTLVHLAVLGPHCLSVYRLIVDNASEPDPSYDLSSVYSHNFKRTASNMTFGSFGGSRDDGECICVQSMDGQLSFYIQDSPAFHCFLPDFLLPGPLAYIPSTNVIVTVNSSHVFQAYKYQSLSVAGTSSDEEMEKRTLSVSSSQKKINPDWVVNLGEHVIQLQVVGGSEDGHCHIIALGEKSLFCLTQSGVVRFMKKLDFIPSCLYSYSSMATSPEASPQPVMIKTLLSSHSNQLLVLQESSIVWAASLDHTPVDMTVATFQEQRGVIVTLGSEGHLVCSYLGTDPTLFSAINTTTRDANFEEMEKELNALNKVIKTSVKEGLVVANTPQPNLRLWAEFDPSSVRVVEFDDGDGDGDGDGGDGGDGSSREYRPVKKCVEVKVHVESSSGPALNDVTINISAPLPLTTHPSHFTLPEVSSTELVPILLVTVICMPSLLPTTTSILLSATYNIRDGNLQVIEHEVHLPLHLYSQPIYPEKNAAFKVTINATPCEADMSKLFPSELVLSHAPPQAIGFRYLSGSTVTVVASKATQRYRIQSDSLAALSSALNWLLQNLEAHFKPGTSLSSSSFTPKFTPPLPLNEYFEIIERHMKLRRNLEQCREWLGRHAHQFRSIQKRLLTRFKDKTPVGLAHLDTLLDGTYMQLMALGDKSEVLGLELQECSNQLSCATRLIHTLLKLCSDMNEEDFMILTSALTPIVNSDGEQGWEEITDAALTHLLRTHLAKSLKDQHEIYPTSNFELPSDSHKLKKHIALVCDRIIKGYLPSGRRQQEATQSLSPTNNSQEDDKRTSLELNTPPPQLLAPLDGPNGYRKCNFGGGGGHPSMPTLPEDTAERVGMPTN